MRVGSLGPSMGDSSHARARKISPSLSSLRTRRSSPTPTFPPALARPWLESALLWRAAIWPARALLLAWRMGSIAGVVDLAELGRAHDVVVSASR